MRTQQQVSDELLKLRWFIYASQNGVVSSAKAAMEIRRLPHR